MILIIINSYTLDDANRHAYNTNSMQTEIQVYVILNGHK